MPPIRRVRTFLVGPEDIITINPAYEFQIWAELRTDERIVQLLPEWLREPLTYRQASQFVQSIEKEGLEQKELPPDVQPMVEKLAKQISADQPQDGKSL